MRISISRFWGIFSLVCIFVLFIAGYTFWGSMNSQTACYLYIDQNDNSDSVRQKVAAESDFLPALLFRCLSQTIGHASPVRAGRYDLSRNVSPFQLFRNLRNGRQAPVRFTVPIVRTNADLVRVLGKNFEPSEQDFLKALGDSALLATHGQTPATALCLFLPNTYEIYWSLSPAALLKRMAQESEAFWSDKRKGKATTQGLTPNEVITLASIVEQETAYTPEKPQVAGMYLNRLRAGMPLQADPTVKFALQDFTLRRILHHHLQVQSPYNTYLHRGLPPGPICIPSLASIEAVLDATQHNYLYMCAKEDFSGSHNFAATYEQHLQNARKYTQALDKRNIR